MRFELFIAARYLRAKRRQAVIGVITVISVIGVAAGVASLIVALAITNGLRQDLQNQLLGATSHVNLVQAVQHEGITDWRNLMARLEKQPHVVAVAPTIYEQAMAARGARASGVVLKGVLPEYENRVSELLKSIKLGSAAKLNSSDAPPCASSDHDCSPELPTIVLGTELAATLGATVGSVVTVTSPQGELSPLGPVPKYERFKVVGIFNSGFYNYDSAWAFIRLKDAQRLFGLGDVITVLEFKIDDIYKAPQVSEQLTQAAGKGYAATNWIEENKALFRALEVERKAAFITVLLIVLVAALNILISLIMMVMEKTKDIAVLISMGARRQQIRRIFMLQGVLIGWLGTIAGLIVGYGLAIAGAKYHLIRLSAEVYSIDYLPFSPRALDGLVVAGVALLISFVATLYPSWSAARVLPAEALRYE
ncbi:MAG TPA: FtsX-like permease family protein [Candidatus Angelobacter sp.]|nr:FtsX-like permease family protein [Candidatus Angelobacter sp.]